MVDLKEHPLPARIMHWIHLASMVGLTFSGFYIHRPFFAGAMGAMRFVHFVCMYVILLDLGARVYWSFFGKEHDWREFVLTGDDFGKLPPTIAYYLFLRKDHPETSLPSGKAGKYNPLQKLTYNFWTLLLVIQGITGFALYQPALTSKTWGPFFQWSNTLVGGAAHMRTVHYLIMWIFVVTTFIHLYLALAEDFPQFLYMLFGAKGEKA